MRKKQPKTYNDGVALICIQKEKERDFNAHINPVSREDMEIKGKLYFSLSSIRVEDMEFAERIHKKLSMKIKTPNCPLVSRKNKIIIGNVLYKIFRIDPSKDKTELFIYMEEERIFA